jgi:hypothetical protein
MIRDGLSSSTTTPARASAAASFIDSVTREARTRSAPAKMPGKASTLLIWLGKSLRPVATTEAYRWATSGWISGSGLAMAKTNAPLAMVATASSGTVPPLTPTKTSAPASAAASGPLSPPGLVIRASSRFTSVRSARSWDTTPLRSQTTTSRTPAPSRILAMATPAAPAPEITTRRPVMSRPVSRAALVSAASVTTAVPCWSSWKTGMSTRSWSRRSISKQRGAEMSSRLMPPKEGASRATVSTISSTSRQSSATGTASTPPNSLKRIALPSITGSEAAGPMSPRPSTALPSVTTATTWERQVYSWTSSGRSAMASQTRATPGV